MKFFVPEWNDRVDADYNFITDEHSGKPSERNSNYIWHIFGWRNVPIDGVLISRAKAEETKSKYKEMRENGFYEYMDLPSNIETISDCGAFDYIEEDEPRYEPKDMMEFYSDLNIDTGVTIDHLITKKDQEDKEYRYNITIDNAKEMFDLWEENSDYYENFRLMGAIQGWDPNSYAKSAKELLDYGFRYIGIGGVAKAQTDQIENIIKKVGEEVKHFEKENGEKIDIHLFGFAKDSLFDVAARCGVTSFDSASMLRRAWLGVSNNYHKSNGKQYGGLRVRYAKSVVRNIKKSAKKKKENSEDLTDLESLALEDEENLKKRIKKKEQIALEALRKYDDRKLDFNQAFSALKEYEEISGDPGKNLEYYKETLNDRPWEDCDCPICTKLGIEVAIFRGNNRNRRRGFHNTNVFYREFRKKIPKVLVFSNCSNTKKNTNNKIPAYKRYSESSNFKTFWNQVHDLPIIDIGVLSAKYGLILHYEKIPEYDYKIQEEDVPRFVDELEEKLVRYDKVFFHGLGLYRKVVEKVVENIKTDIDIYPKNKYTDRDSLDIIEYKKQAKKLREDILEYFRYEKCFVPKYHDQSKLKQFKEE